jgi:single-strand DNA-binding protein
MSNLRNKVQLIGNLGADPEVKTLAGDKMIARFSLATTENRKDKEGKKMTETYWHNLVVWGKLAAIAEKYLTKGKQIAVEGKLTNRSYEDKEGNRRYVTEIIVSDFVMMNNK